VPWTRDALLQLIIQTSMPPLGSHKRIHGRSAKDRTAPAGLRAAWDEGRESAQPPFPRPPGPSLQEAQG
jgi:hypothetical protein